MTAAKHARRPKHARRLRLRWKPWAKWLHLCSFLWATLFVSVATVRLHTTTFAGQLFLSAFWIVVVYAVVALVFGILISTMEKYAEESK
jgi:hypothetical protein